MHHSTASIALPLLCSPLLHACSNCVSAPGGAAAVSTEGEATGAMRKHTASSINCFGFLAFKPLPRKIK